MNQQGYLDQQESFLRGIEKDIADQIRPTMNLAISAMESLPEDASEADYAKVLQPLNDELAGLIGATLFNNQRTIAERAQQVVGGTVPRMKSPTELLTYGTVDSDNIANQFKKKNNDQ